MSSEPRKSCAIRDRSLIGDTGLVADARWYPNNRICSGSCMLRGKDLLITDGSYQTTVVADGTEIHHPAAHCIKQRNQKSRRQY